MTTGFVFDERSLWHESGSWAELSEWVQPSTMPEAPEAKRRIKNLLEVSGLLGRLQRIQPRAATRLEIERFHDPHYVQRIVELTAAGGGDAGGFTPFRNRAYDFAALSAGGVITAIDNVLDGTVDNVYALVRPPGHHASPSTGDGFCLFNNICVGVHHARERGVRRIAVLDWDVHHGNGTEDGFYDDGETLTISVHQDGWYPPGGGSALRRGEGAGLGANLNVPLPAGSGEGAYRDAFDRVVVPALERFRPELLVVAAGYDANFMDPLARMTLDSEAFRWMTERVLDVVASTGAHGPVVVHEGGYSDLVVPFCALAVIEALSGERTEVVDGFAARNRSSPGQALEAHQQAAVDAVVALWS